MLQRRKLRVISWLEFEKECNDLDLHSTGRLQSRPCPKVSRNSRDRLLLPLRLSEFIVELIFIFRKNIERNIYIIWWNCFKFGLFWKWDIVDEKEKTGRISTSLLYEVRKYLNELIALNLKSSAVSLMSITEMSVELASFLALQIDQFVNTVMVEWHEREMTTMFIIVFGAGKN